MSDAGLPPVGGQCIPISRFNQKQLVFSTGGSINLSIARSGPCTYTNAAQANLQWLGMNIGGTEFDETLHQLLNQNLPQNIRLAPRVRQVVVPVDTGALKTALDQAGINIALLSVIVTLDGVINTDQLPPVAVIITW